MVSSGEKYMKLLFFGDSLTDMYRNFDKNVDMSTSYGTGFVFDIAAQLMYKKPGYYQIVNRGVGGNKVTDLFARYQEDVVDEKPDILTILIGVNDVWHEIATKSGTSLDVFEKTYLKMVNDIKIKLPKTKIIIMEPFFTKGAATNGVLERFKDLYQYASIVKKIANETKCFFIPLQQSFNELIKNGGETQILFDGIHTNPGGAHLIATKWLEMFESLQ